MDLSSTRLSEYADLVNVSRVRGEHPETRLGSRPYFEVLVVDDLTPRAGDGAEAQLRELRSADDDFIYEIVVAPPSRTRWPR
jgi:hypothetical protein